MTGSSEGGRGRWRLWLALLLAGLGLAVAWLGRETDGPTRTDPRAAGELGGTDTDGSASADSPDAAASTGADDTGETDGEHGDTDADAGTDADDADSESGDTTDGGDDADTGGADVESAPDASDGESRATFELFEDSDAAWRFRLVHDNGRRLARSARGFSRKGNATEGIDRVRRLLPKADRLRYDPAGFEVYEDEGGDYRWRLRHRNGRLLADGGEGYADRRGAREAMEAVRERIADAPVADEADAESDGDGEGNEDGESPPATVELYEDEGGKHRWRLRHRNGNLVAESSRGYTSASGARDGLDRAREHAPAADAVTVGEAAVEVYEDEGGRWRWRLRHRNGTVLATSTRGYSDRSGAVDGLDSARRNAPDAPVDEVGAVEAGEEGEEATGQENDIGSDGGESVADGAGD